MCTITLSYDQNNALARRKLAALMKTGLFEQRSMVETTVSNSDASLEAHKQEVKEFLYGSRILAAQAFAKHL